MEVSTAVPQEQDQWTDTGSSPILTSSLHVHVQTLPSPLPQVSATKPFQEPCSQAGSFLEATANRGTTGCPETHPSPFAWSSPHNPIWPKAQEGRGRLFPGLSLQWLLAEWVWWTHGGQAPGFCFWLLLLLFWGDFREKQ